ncbi:MAG: hypothetical protein LBK08_03205 [Treponema sp.]|jgi:hypothetical protein|nr:hypothetical protein [Treponema sp.]
MKRIIAIVLFAAGTAGMIFAQSAGDAPANRPGAGRRLPEKTTVSGTLGLREGMIILESGDSFYYVPGLSRFAGFIDGLKEGAAVSIEGRVFRSPSGSLVLRTEKLGIAGRSYDLAPAIAEAGPGPNWRGAPSMDREKPRMRGRHGYGGPHERNGWNGRGPGRRPHRMW